MLTKILLRKKLDYLKNSLASIIYPLSYNCLNCNKQLDSVGLCEKCGEKIEFCNNLKYIKGVKVYSIAYYGYSVKKLILDFKYKNNFSSGEFLGNLLLNRLNELNEEFEYITYVPSSKKKIKKRGFNQCKVLAKYLECNTNMSCIELLQKTNDIKEQKHLNAKDRKSNIKNAFSLLNDKNVENKKVLLIDDVITTGATIEECINELKKIKNIQLTVMVVAQSLN